MAVQQNAQIATVATSRLRIPWELLPQPGGLEVLRGVIRGFSEEARTRGFPSPSLGGFGFVVSYSY